MNTLSNLFKKFYTRTPAYDFLVLGADGMQGNIVSRDLLEKKYRVLMADLHNNKLKKLLKKNTAGFELIDLRDIPATIALIKKSGASVVINCAEGDWNLNVYQACVQTKTHCLDLGSHPPMTKEQLALHKQFKENDTTAITGCGSTPGIGNVMLRYAAQKFDTIETIEAGFAWDSNIKEFVVPFSIISILEEFTDPALFMENGKWVEKIPLENAINRNHREVGEQEIFPVIHSEPVTFYQNYKDKGVKNIRFYGGFPKHSKDKIISFMELGLGDREPIYVDGVKVVPPEFLSEVLKKLPVPEGYKEYENLWVELTGTKDDEDKKILMECIVPTLKGWEAAGCNIDTGFPCAIMAEMIKNGVITKRGSFAPEAIVPEEPFFKELKKKKMLVYENGRNIN